MSILGVSIEQERGKNTGEVCNIYSSKYGAAIVSDLFPVSSQNAEGESFSATNPSHDVMWIS